jgi:hypothetical protein
MPQRYWPEVFVEWIVVAGLSDARIFIEDDEFQELKLVAELRNPLVKEKEHSKDDIIDHFALHIFRYLNHHWVEEDFDHLEIFAPPKLLGSIRKHFSEKFLNVTRFIPRDLEKKSAHDLESRMNFR